MLILDGRCLFLSGALAVWGSWGTQVRVLPGRPLDLERQNMLKDGKTKWAGLGVRLKLGA